MQGGNRSETKEGQIQTTYGSSGSARERDWVVGSQILTGGLCQDMIFLNFYFDQFYTHLFNTCPFHIADVFLMALQFHHS